MKKLAVTAVAAALLGSQAAYAADQVVVDDQPAASDWSGLYVGAFGGWAHNRSTATDITGEEYGGSTPGAQLSLSSDGFLGGVTAGYNFQRGSWVFGPEIELGWLSNEETYVVNGDDGLYVDYGFYGVAAGRVGYAWNRTLFFGKAGLAFADIENTGGEFDGVGDEDSGGYNGFDGNEAGFGDDLRFGWATGGGVEHAFNDRWSIKGEYLYAHFGNRTYDNLQAENEPFRFKDSFHSLKFGINYRF